MGANYTRQSTYTDGDTISAADTNDEFDQLLAAFAAPSLLEQVQTPTLQLLSTVTPVTAFSHGWKMRITSNSLTTYSCPPQKRYSSATLQYP